MTLLVRAVAIFAAKAALVSALAAAVALAVCSITGRSAPADIALALLLTGVCLGGLGTLVVGGGWMRRGDFLYQYTRMVPAQEAVRQDIADSDRNLALLWICISAAAPLVIASYVITRVTS